MSDLPQRRNPGTVRYPLRDIATRIDVMNCGCMHIFNVARRVTETETCTEHTFDVDEWNRRFSL